MDESSRQEKVHGRAGPKFGRSGELAFSSLNKRIK